MITIKLSLIMGKSRWGTSPCCCFTYLIYQVLNAQIGFVYVVNKINQYNLGISHMKYGTNVTSNSVIVSEPEKIHIQNEFLLPPHIRSCLQCTSNIKCSNFLMNSNSIWIHFSSCLKPHYITLHSPQTVFMSNVECSNLICGIKH